MVSRESSSRACYYHLLDSGCVAETTGWHTPVPIDPHVSRDLSSGRGYLSSRDRFT